MKLVSSAFDDGAAIPRRFTCDGENLSPPLQWSGTPAGARSFVLLCDDPDAPAGTWHHWAAYDIPPAVTELAVDAEQNAKLRQAVNDFRKVGYGGPCPPHGHGPHHYHFRLLALSTDQLRAKANASCRDIERKARKYAIAEAILVGGMRDSPAGCRDVSRRVTQSNGFKLLNPSYVRKIKRLVVIDPELRLALSADALRRTSEQRQQRRASESWH